MTFKAFAKVHLALHMPHKHNAFKYHKIFTLVQQDLGK
jgi:4-diphosphocytidyl-2C-methyl-D-erythritol kinase